MSAEGEQQRSRSEGKFLCPECGATMRWDPDAGSLTCAYCGHAKEVERGDGLIVERSLSDQHDAERGFGAELRVLACSNCGARVALEESVTAESCVYCGAAAVLAQEANRNTLRPESLVPLELGQERARDSFQKWLRRLWFRPNDLKQVKAATAIGVYVPFWTFDCHVESQWTAESGTYEHVSRSRMTRKGMRTRSERRVRWKAAAGRRHDDYDDFLVHASTGLDEGLVRKLGGFDTSGLVPYRPHYLAGWRAEEYQLDLEQGWRNGLTRIVELQEARCGGDVPGDTHRNLRVANQVSGVQWKHVLLPVWSLTYSYRGQTFIVLVNGQSGIVVGRAPWSWVKLTLLVVGLAVIGLAIAAAS